MTPEELDEARALEAYREWLEEGCDGDDIDGHINDIVITTSFLMTQAFLAGARMARAEKLSLLNWLSDQKSLEVSWGGDPEKNGAWSVYRVTGGLNDREWHLIATGETPIVALKNARSTLAKYRGEA